MRKPKPITEWVFLGILDGLMINPVEFHKIIWLHQGYLVITGRL
jgi:hypothetical protein